MATKNTLKRRPKRHVIGEGYPWYHPLGRGITLYTKANGHGERVRLDPKSTGAWKKFKLILVEV